MILSGRHQRGTPQWKRLQQEEDRFGDSSRVRVDTRGTGTVVMDQARPTLPRQAQRPTKRSGTEPHACATWLTRAPSHVDLDALWLTGETLAASAENKATMCPRRLCRIRRPPQQGVVWPSVCRV